MTGNIIFFDWQQDGHTDHVGIVEKVENGKPLLLLKSGCQK